MGGAISKVGPEETAFVHRNARFLIAYQTNWTNPDDDQTNLDWAENIYQSMRPFVSGGAYVNIPDRSLQDWPTPSIRSNRRPSRLSSPRRANYLLSGASDSAGRGA